MSALTAQPTKSFSGEMNCHIFHLTTVNDQDTLRVRFNKVTNVITCNRSSTATVYATASGSTLTFNVSSGTPTVDVKVFGIL